MTMTLPSTSATLTHGLTEWLLFSRAKDERIGMVVVEKLIALLLRVKELMLISYMNEKTV